jgi:hypothetical protein
MKTHVINVSKGITLDEFAKKLGMPTKIVESMFIQHEICEAPHPKLVLDSNLLEVCAIAFEVNIVVMPPFVEKEPQEPKSKDIPTPPGRFRKGLAKGVSFLFNGSHFTCKVMADGVRLFSDGVAIAEGHIVGKLLKKDPRYIVEERVNETAEIQSIIANGITVFYGDVKKSVGKAHVHIMELFHETVTDNIEEPY